VKEEERGGGAFTIIVKTSNLPLRLLSDVADARPQNKKEKKERGGEKGHDVEDNNPKSNPTVAAAGHF